MALDEIFDRYQAAVAAGRESTRDEIVSQTRKALNQEPKEKWEWMRAALETPERQRFVAEVFRKSPVPRNLLPAMVQAAVRAPGLEESLRFLTPCIATYGIRRVTDLLTDCLKNGDETEREGAKRALHASAVASAGVQRGVVKAPRA